MYQTRKRKADEEVMLDELERLRKESNRVYGDAAAARNSDDEMAADEDDDFGIGAITDDDDDACGDNNNNNIVGDEFDVGKYDRMVEACRSLTSRHGNIQVCRPQSTKVLVTATKTTGQIQPAAAVDEQSPPQQTYNEGSVEVFLLKDCNEEELELDPGDGDHSSAVKRAGHDPEVLHTDQLPYREIKCLCTTIGDDNLLENVGCVLLNYRDAFPRSQMADTHRFIKTLLDPNSTSANILPKIKKIRFTYDVFDDSKIMETGTLVLPMFSCSQSHNRQVYSMYFSEQPRQGNFNVPTIYEHGQLLLVDTFRSLMENKSFVEFDDNVKSESIVSYYTNS